MTRGAVGTGEPAPPVMFALAGGGGCAAELDRAEHLRTDDATLRALWPHARVIVLDDDGRTHADEARQLLARAGDEIDHDPARIDTATFLGLDAQGAGWFALEAESIDSDAPERLDLRSAAMYWPSLHSAAFAQARALQHWRRRHRFCGACGGTVEFVRAGWQGHCERCGIDHYPRTDPAVIAAVGSHRGLLLGRQAAWPARRWSVLAGFVEPGESLEQAVAREVMEETGVHVHRCRYLASQPWPFPSTLMLGFIAEGAADDPRVTGELEEARWFSAEEIRIAQARDAIVDTDADDGGPLLTAPVSIARWLIEQWLLQADDGASPAAD